MLEEYVSYFELDGFLKVLDNYWKLIIIIIRVVENELFVYKEFNIRVWL